MFDVCCSISNQGPQRSQKKRDYYLNCAVSANILVMGTMRYKYFRLREIVINNAVPLPVFAQLSFAAVLPPDQHTRAINCLTQLVNFLYDQVRFRVLHTLTLLHAEFKILQASREMARVREHARHTEAQAR